MDTSEKIYKILDKGDQSNKLYTVAEAAIILKIDKQTIANHIEKGNLKASKIWRRILISHCEIFDNLDEIIPLKYKRTH